MPEMQSSMLDRGKPATSYTHRLLKIVKNECKDSCGWRISCGVAGNFFSICHQYIDSILRRCYGECCRHGSSSFIIIQVIRKTPGAVFHFLIRGREGPYL